MTENALPAEEPRDWTRMIWIGIAVLFAAMLLITALAGRSKPPVSMVRARHILIKFDASDPADRQRALELISELRQRILDGEDFAEVARKYSEDPVSARHGGKLKEAERGTYVPAFEKYVWQAPVGELSEVIETSFGFHLIEVTERHLSKTDQYEQQLEERAREAVGAGPENQE